jgi:hypothetical protein
MACHYHIIITSIITSLSHTKIRSFIIDLFSFVSSFYKNLMMNKQIWLGVILMLALACKKTVPEPTDPPVPTHPSMLVTDLGDRSIAFGKSASFDLDNNGAKMFYLVQC